MTYQTELPEGFKTWNELWHIYKSSNNIVNGVLNIVNAPGSAYCYEVEHIKAKCYDEIMELAGMIHKQSIESQDINFQFWQLDNFRAHFEKLTHTKLFK